LADTIKSDIEESLAPATEELVSWVLEPDGTAVADLVRRFPEAADLLREATRFLVLEPTAVLTEPVPGAKPLDDTQQNAPPGQDTPFEGTRSLARGRALDICRQFEGDLKHGRGPRIEDCVRDVGEPQKSALLTMLLAAELRFRVQGGERPPPEEFCRRFPDHRDLIAGVFTTALGPDRIGPFVVVRLLGEGNFGRVYLCRDEQLDRLVAVKVPRADRFNGPRDLDRFLQEARLAARVKHGGIVTVHQVDRDRAVGCFLVLDYIDGRSLSALLRAERLTPRRAAQMVILVAEALAFAHEQGLVHRDLKPDNILVDARERPHIADFGLAIHDDDRWPKKGEVAGTPPYMAPEQVRGESHRLDGRTDLWALGVILYLMLTDHRPFEGNCAEDVFEDILNREAVPPRQRDRTIPKGLERICLKCLSKRMADRYATAADLADDLRHWLRTGEEETVAPTSAGPANASDGTKTVSSPGLLSADSLGMVPVRIRPKGLRAFDKDDRDFFLGLLPGPRDRDGLPESLRFWKSRIEPGEYEDPFAVGLLCGPSGSGKTSMIRAGLLCRLSFADVIPVYIEASPGATETRLLANLRRVADGRADSLSLPETVAGMRSRTLLSPGPKVLIVLDQFEQWLHADRDASEAEGELVRALRQCDGTNVQCLILVRDDFAMAAARFMRALEIRLIESDNFATVDPFDLVHARKVLRAFGVAYGRVDDDDHGQFDRFLDRAVAGLAEEGKIAPVRLALFAQMLKDKPWSPATLKDMRGLEGIGAKFLEESLDGTVANPEHRLHAQAARLVLRALLPYGAADIKGHMRSYQELLEASGYARRPGDFDTLLAILGTDLRLITPTDPRGPDVGDAPEADHHAGRYYHLTHDYLVPSLREWLTRKDRETIGGRAAIRLGERTAEWTARRSRRYLPTWWEWIVILLFTPRSRRSPAERRLIGAATRYHAARAAILGAAVLLLGLLAADRLGAVRARVAVGELENATARNVPKVIQNLAFYRRWADPLLRETIGDDRAEPHRKARARLALLPVDPSQAGELLAPLIDGDPDLFLVIRQALCDHGDRSILANGCRELLRNERESPDHRLRAGMALAGLLGDAHATEDAGLRGASGFLASHFVSDLVAHPDRYNDWLIAMHPARALLIPALEQVFRDTSSSDGARSLVASVLANFAAEDSDVLVTLLLDANEHQFGVIFHALSEYRATVAPRLALLVKSSPPPAATREDRAYFARRQANAAIALVRLGSADPLWPLLAASANPGLRSFLIDRLAPMETPPSILIERLSREPDSSVRAAILLSLRRFGSEQLPASERAGLAPYLLALYRDDPDPAVHTAAGSLLKIWGRGEQIRSADQGLVSVQLRGARRWYIGRDGMTMVLLDGERAFEMGSPEDEPGRSNNEKLHTVDVGPFEITTTEVTVGQFRPFLEHDKSVLEHYPAPPVKPSPDFPQTHVTWCEAAYYCNWRSQQEGIPEDQWCYEPREDGKFEPGMKIKADFISKIGYRLPTEAEWEYACRAGTVTSHCFGDLNELMVRYGCCLINTQELPVPVESFLPNAFGLFDMHGNVFEWCQDIYADQGNVASKIEEIVDEKVERLIRGGGYFTRPSHVRSARRYKDPPVFRNDAGGFRLVRSRPRPDAG
jgi:eukaryotic-like serine/threonine-protein kinase